MSAPYKIAVIPGDGIGPEVVEAELVVLQSLGIPFDFTHHPAGDDCEAKTGEPLPAATLAAAKAARAVIFGAAGKSAARVILKLRRELETYANLRPSRAYPGVGCLQPATDLMLVRENSECLYVGIEAELLPGVITATRLITEKACTRIAKVAFEWARKNGKTKVTAGHKNNVLIKGDSLFLDCCRKVAAGYPGIAYEEAIIDALSMRLVMKPTDFQVVVTTNLFGDIISDLAAGLIGGLGMCPSANLGDRHAIFEPVHGSAPDIAGQKKANPFAAIACGAMVLEYLGENAAAKRVEAALAACLQKGLTTPDLGGRLTTLEMARAVVDQLK